ncbi:trichohyalin-like [Palaemon carinicauda]|uniref:trichohyalin-like n=1 Tax=Palaemon carinicauda TaxID=392227 RepID=UPI0035B5D8E9
MLDASFDPRHLTNFNKCNEVPPNTRGHEKILSGLQNLQRDFTRHQEDVQIWRMQEECNGDLASEEINEMYRLEKEYEKILRELEEEREPSKEQKALRSKERKEINRLKEQNRIQMEANGKILRELVEEGQHSKEKKDQTIEERKMNRLKRVNKILLEERQNIIHELEVERELKRDKVSEISQLKDELFMKEFELIKTRSELNYWMLESLEKEGLIADANARESKLRGIVETVRGSHECLTNKLDKQHSLDELENKSEAEDYRKSTDQNLEDTFEVESVVYVPEETKEEHYDTNAFETEMLQFFGTEKLKHLDFRSNIVQDLLNDIKNNLEKIPIEQNNMALRAHLGCHQDCLKRARGPAVQRTVLELQECWCQNERPNGNQDQPIGLNEPKEIGVLIDVIPKKVESEKDEVRKDDQPEEECPEEVCPEKDSWSKEVEKSKLDMTLEKLYNKIYIEFKNKTKKLEKTFRDMLDASFDPRHLTNFNKCNEVPPDTRGHEKILSGLQNLQRDFTRHQEDVQRWRMQEECNGDLASEEINEMYRLEKEYEKILRELEEEREPSKEQKALRSEERKEINRLKEQNRIQMEANGKILRELVEEGQHSKEKKDQTIEERKMNRLKRVNKILLEERQNIIHELEVERELKRDKVSEISQLKDELFMKECELIKT